MLRIRPFHDAAAAGDYYTRSLSKEDYYSEGKEVAGLWHGKAAERLGLKDAVKPERFAALAENRHPLTGQKLTARTKHGRIVAYDFNFHPPKSVSLLYAFTGDKEILRAFRLSVHEAMLEIERHAETRVRKGGRDENRVTGNLAWAEFIHYTSRPVGGIPDPHLHAHCFTFNATFDETEQRWKAANYYEQKRNAPYFQSIFHAALARRLNDLGFPIQKTRLGWEVEGIPRTLIDKYSRRTAKIEAVAEKRGITNAKLKDGLGALTRESKRKGMNGPQLFAAWNARLADDERRAIEAVAARTGSRGKLPGGSKEAVDAALKHCFERASVVRRKELIETALKFGLGRATHQGVTAELAKRELISKRIEGEDICTTHAVLAEEKALLAGFRAGRGRHRILHRGAYQFSREYLSAEQKAAALHVLKSKDQIAAIQGAAGAGKTTLMHEVVEAIQANGKRVHAFAPSAAAARDTLREAGFADADTLASLLNSKQRQREVRGQVIWIDEAGMVGVEDMNRILQIAGSDTRILLTGDIRQHGPVALGDAFRILQKFGGLKPAEVKTIRRQENELYRSAVTALSNGDLPGGFRQLEELGAIRVIADDRERYRTLARDYIAATQGRKRPFVVSPTHAESRLATAAIREELRAQGRLGAERLFVRYQNLQWTEAERGRPDWYQPGLMLRFHEKAKGGRRGDGINRGDLLEVVGVEKSGRVLLSNRKNVVVPLDFRDAKKFTIYEKQTLALAKGDALRITCNSESQDGRRLNNGNTYTVAGFTKGGGIRLSSGAVLAPDHGHFDHGYCSTSYSAQSKTTDPVFVAQSALSRPAGSLEQFYVSVSRGKTRLAIYTDDREALQRSVGGSTARISGFELASESSAHEAPRKGRHRMDKTADLKKPPRAKTWEERVGAKRNKPDNVSWEDYIRARRVVEPQMTKPAETKWKSYIKSRRRPGEMADARNKKRLENLYAQAGKKEPATNKMPTARKAKKPAAATKVPAKDGEKITTQKLRSAGEPKPKKVSPENHNSDKTKQRKQKQATEQKQKVVKSTPTPTRRK